MTFFVLTLTASQSSDNLSRVKPKLKRGDKLNILDKNRLMSALVDHSLELMICDDKLAIFIKDTDNIPDISFWIGVIVGTLDIDVSGVGKLETINYNNEYCLCFSNVYITESLIYTNIVNNRMERQLTVH